MDRTWPRPMYPHHEGLASVIDVESESATRPWRWRPMNLVLWAVQAMLALVFLGAGIMKLTKPRAEIAQQKGMAYAGDVTDGQIKAIGLAEVLGAIGLILPWALGIAHAFTPVAALGLVVLM